jgi:hypothetical protein
MHISDTLMQIHSFHSSNRARGRLFSSCTVPPAQKSVTSQRTDEYWACPSLLFSWLQALCALRHDTERSQILVLMEGREDKVVMRGRHRAASRGRSAIITQKEVSLLLRRDDDKSPPTAATSGFVRSMTQFYTELCHVASDKNNNKIEV